ncbi:MAG: methyltransferase domain-containing protein [Alphaproteobacteria bacterium]|nr:methyltransferase domain-containing protein [Alphaproteobacteria bacterium]MCB9691825.1 methyltransferase domain-containing protein [Alphaproteobacteria bacterium]
MDHDEANGDDVHAWVQDYYGKVLQASADLKTNACCATGGPPAHLLAPLSNVHADVLARFYGCGFPIPEALEGRVVVDLGCGTGRDVYVLAQLVGERGKVHGVDMTPEQLEVARATEDWHRQRFGYARSNVELHQAFIEDLGFLADASVDVVVSNCVVNLSPRKDIVMREIARILRPGGEFYFSDVFCDRRLPPEVANDPILHSECLGGAMYGFDFEQLAKSVGFQDPRAVSSGPITIHNAEIERKVGAARFTSVTLRLLKLDGLEARCEDYGQIATYRRPIPGHEALFVLDDHHTFEIGRPERVCGNTAAMLRDTRFGAHFDVVGDTSVHFGVFDCGPTMASAQYAVPTAPSGGSCC